MKEQDLHDEFKQMGNDYEAFAELLKSIDRSTSMVTMETDRLKLLPVLPREYETRLRASAVEVGEVVRTKGVKEQSILLAELNNNQILFYPPIRLKTLSLKHILSRGGSKDLYEETKKHSKLLIQYENRMYFTSPNLIGTLSARAGLNGAGMYETSIERELFLMRRFKEYPQTVSALVRKGEDPGTGIYKIMAMFSQRYVYFPQKKLLDIIADIGKLAGETPQSYQWEVNHFVSSIYLEFPQLSQALCEQFQIEEALIAGLWLCTSDVGDASLSARPTWRLEDSIVMGDALSMAHYSTSDFDQFAQRVSEGIIEKYPVFLKRLAVLKEQILPQPAEALSRMCMKLKVYDILGKRRTTKLIEDEEQRLANNASGYDLVLEVLRMPAACELPDGPEAKFKRACYKMVFCTELEKKAKKSIRRAG